MFVCGDVVLVLSLGRRGTVTDTLAMGTGWLYKVQLDTGVTMNAPESNLKLV